VVQKLKIVIRSIRFSSPRPPPKGEKCTFFSPPLEGAGGGKYLDSLFLNTTTALINFAFWQLDEKV
ncbi:MAG: hypothetical protein AAFZ15_23945, partial [Bacteroidota bacterium]